MVRGRLGTQRLVIAGALVDEPEGGFSYRSSAQQGGLWLTIERVQPAILGQIPCVLGGKAAFVAEASVRREVQDPRDGRWTSDFSDPGRTASTLDAVRRECGARKGVISNSPKDEEVEAWKVAQQALAALMRLGRLFTPTQNEQLEGFRQKLETGLRVYQARSRRGLRWEELYGTLNPRVKASRARKESVTRD